MTFEHELIEYPVTDFLDEADHRANKIGTLDRSMRGLQGAQVGALGEVVGMRYLRDRGVTFTEVFSTTHDVITKSGNTLEFKTKERTVRPSASYECTAPAYNKDHQQPNMYLFISLLAEGKSDAMSRFSRAYILGTIRHDEFEAKAKLWRQGELDPSNGWVAKIDCWNVPISALTAP